MVGLNSVEEITQRWLVVDRESAASVEKLPHYLEIRYEDLVSNTESALGKSAIPSIFSGPRARLLPQVTRPPATGEDRRASSGAAGTKTPAGADRALLSPSQREELKKSPQRPQPACTVGLPVERLAGPPFSRCEDRSLSVHRLYRRSRLSSLLTVFGPVPWPGCDRVCSPTSSSLRPVCFVSGAQGSGSSYRVSRPARCVSR